MKKLWKKFKHWCCKVGLCNLDECVCDCHEQPKGRSKAYFPTVKEKKIVNRGSFSKGKTPAVAKKIVTKTPAPKGKKLPLEERGHWEG